MKLFQWTHAVPREVNTGDRPWVRQTHCYVVLKTNKEFCERFHYTPHTMKGWVQVEKVSEIREWRLNHPGVKLAVENPGICYGQDIWLSKHGDNVYIEIPQ